MTDKIHKISKFFTKKKEDKKKTAENKLESAETGKSPRSPREKNNQIIVYEEKKGKTPKSPRGDNKPLTLARKPKNDQKLKINSPRQQEQVVLSLADKKREEILNLLPKLKYFSRDVKAEDATNKIREIYTWLPELFDSGLDEKALSDFQILSDLLQKKETSHDTLFECINRRFPEWPKMTNEEFKKHLVCFFTHTAGERKNMYWTMALSNVRENLLKTGDIRSITSLFADIDHQIGHWKGEQLEQSAVCSLEEKEETCKMFQIFQNVGLEVDQNLRDQFLKLYHSSPVLYESVHLNILSLARKVQAQRPAPESSRLLLEDIFHKPDQDIIINPSASPNTGSPVNQTDEETTTYIMLEWFLKIGLDVNQEIRNDMRVLYNHSRKRYDDTLEDVRQQQDSVKIIELPPLSEKQTLFLKNLIGNPDTKDNSEQNYSEN